MLTISRLIDTDPLGAHLDYFGLADNTGIGGLTGRSTEVNSGWLQSGKSAQEAVAEKPFADLDAIWGKGIINGDQYVQIVYLTL